MHSFAMHFKKEIACLVTITAKPYNIRSCKNKVAFYFGWANFA